VSVTSGPGPLTDDGFRHEAYLYAGTAEFLEGTVPFVAEGLEAGERVMVAVGAPRADMLRTALDDPPGDAVEFVDMAALGRNPARIIPAWRDFASRVPAGAGLRGVGEPIWAGRTTAEIVECQQHEALLNRAFVDGRSWRLLCPYDVSALERSVIDEARRSHPLLLENGTVRESPRFPGVDRVIARLDDPLPAPPTAAHEVPFGPGELGTVRRAVARHTARVRLGSGRAHDLVLAVNEIATNSLRHGGGRGCLRLWTERGALVCEVRDSGHVADLLVGRARAGADQPGGRGLYLAHQLCDLVQVRSFPDGTVVRLHLTLG